MKIGIRSSCFTRRAAALLYHCDLFLHLFFFLQLNVNTNSSILPHIRSFKSLKIETSSPLIGSNVSSNAFDFSNWIRDDRVKICTFDCGFGMMFKV